ncbi:magnesium transporter CorA family protein [Flavobacterium antarcticum]|uniref:magnesium transporter CorA family protein n=1 Tax=Flavobacterium antarcticum TaxID=271155 RepID=UPI0003B7A243|nr:magnesium transporter CorA family protein [Flavobacterium antarcticum]
MKTHYKNNSGLYEASEMQSQNWIAFQNPTSEEKKYLLEELQIPEDFYNDINDVDERPRIEFENGWQLVIFRIPILSNDVKLPFNTVPVGIIFNESVFVTICFHENEVIQDFINFTTKKKTYIKNDFDLVLKLMLSSGVWYLKYLKQIVHKIKVAEDNLEKSIKNEELQALLHIEKCLVFFMTSIKGNSTVVYRIKKRTNQEHLDPELVEDVEIELRQALEMTKIYSDILTGMMDAYASVISNNLNDIMKKMTLISIILLIPTIIASFYGMNVPNSLEGNIYGMPILISVSILFSALGVFLFMRKKWF